MNKLNPIKYIENMISHHPKSISLWITEGIVINGERYIIKEFRLRDGSLYAVIAENKYTPKYFEVKLAPDEETLKDIYQAIEENKLAIEKEVTDRKNEIARVDTAIKANTTKIEQEIADRKSEIARVDKAIEANTAKIDKEIADRENEIERVDQAIEANTEKINQEITDRQNEITRVDNAINANTSKIDKEIQDRKNEITRVDSAINANTEKINQEISDRTNEINRVDGKLTDLEDKLTTSDGKIAALDKATKDNKAKIDQEIIDRKREIDRVDKATKANKATIDQEIANRRDEITRVDNAINANTAKIDKEITDRKSEIARVEGKITSVEGKLPSGEINLVEYGRPVDGYSPYAGAEYTTHPYYYNGSFKMYIIRNTSTNEKVFGMNRFKVERNTEYTLYFKGFNNWETTNMDVWFLKRVNGSTQDFDSAQRLVTDRKLSNLRAEDVSVTFNTGNYDEGYIRFDNNGTTTAGISADLYFGDVSVKKGKSNNGWSPSLAELASSQDLKTAQSEFKQTTDAIKASVSTVQTAANNAQSTANTAVTKADAAQSTANTNKQTISTLNSSLAQKQDKLTAGTGIAIQGNVISSTVNLTSHHDTQKEQVLASTRNTVNIQHGSNGTSETTKVDTNPAKVLEHDNLLTDNGISKITSGNTTKLGLEYRRVDGARFDLNNLVNGKVRASDFVNAPSTGWLFVSSYSEGSYAIQQAIKLDDQYNTVYVRRKRSGTWGAWREQVGDKSVIDAAISANTTKINQEIQDRKSEIARVEGKITSVEGKIPTSVGGRNYIKDSEYRKANIYVNDNESQDEAFNISSAFWQNSNVYAKKIKLSFYYQPSVAYSTERRFPVYFRTRPWPMIGEVTYPANTTRLIKYTIAMTNALPANFKADQIFMRFDGRLDKGRYHNIGKVMLEVSDVFSDWQPAPEDIQAKITSVENRLITNLDSLNSMPGTLDAVKLTPGSITGDMITGGRLRSTNGWTVIDLTSGIITFNGSSSYIQHSKNNKIFEIQSLLINGSADVRENMIASFGIRKSDNSSKSGIRFSLYNAVGNKPTAQADINADSFSLFDSQNTPLLSVNGSNTYLGNWNIYGWGDIPLAFVYGGLTAKDVGLEGHTESLKKIIEKLCTKTGITWL